MDIERIAHELAITYASAELAKANSKDARAKVCNLLADFCFAYGYIKSRDAAFISELVDKGMSC